MTTSWPTWIQLEQYSALHNLPFATKADGFDGLDAELVFNSKAHVKHIERLLEMSKEGSFKYAGRDTAPDPLIVSGEAAISFGSSSSRGNLVKSREVRLGRGVSSLRSGDHQGADELDHRRRQPVDHDRAEPHAGRNTRRWRNS